MKIVLSRKGFDSSAGGVASPLLDGETPVSLPIPVPRSGRTFAEVTLQGVPLAPLVRDLTRSLRPASSCHLDPDLDHAAVPRADGWRPAFGQVDAAQRHLMHEGVGPGDLFLFFGWFRAAERLDGRWRFVPGAPDQHVIYGWLQIGAVVTLDRAMQARLRRSSPFASHPHVVSRTMDPATNTLYLAANRLSVPGLEHVAGGGLFARRAPARVLTRPDQPLRSLWQLPLWMHPSRGSRVTYHTAASRWALDDGAALLRSVGRGQEFVLTPGDHAAAAEWLRDVFAACR